MSKPKNLDLALARRLAQAKKVDLRRRVRPVRERTMRLGAHCPACGEAPPIQITAEERELHRNRDPDALVGTVKCSVKRCATVYPITVFAYLTAGVAPSKATRTWFPDEDGGEARSDWPVASVTCATCQSATDVQVSPKFKETVLQAAPPNSTAMRVPCGNPQCRAMVDVPTYVLQRSAAADRSEAA